MHPPDPAFPRASIQVLFSANFVAVVVATLFEWRLGDLLTLYWLELIAIGCIATLQLHTAKAAGTFAKSRGYLLILFLAHYGTFCVMYRATIVHLFGGAGPAPWFWGLVWPPLAALAVAHAVSFRRDYLAREAERTSPFDAMWIPYLRELPVHVPLLIAVAIVDPNNLTRTDVLLFGSAKTVVDLVAHVVYHARIATRR